MRPSQRELEQGGRVERESIKTMGSINWIQFRQIGGLKTYDIKTSGSQLVLIVTEGTIQSGTIVVE